MKILLILLFLSIFLSLNTFGQTGDSLTLAALKEAIIYQRTQLELSHKEFRTGTGLVLIGSLALGAGALLSSSDKKTDSPVNDILLISGGVILFAGWVNWIDSHKYIGRAGRWRIKGNSFIIKF